MGQNRQKMGKGDIKGDIYGDIFVDIFHPNFTLLLWVKIGLPGG